MEGKREREQKQKRDSAIEIENGKKDENDSAPIWQRYPELGSQYFDLYHPDDKKERERKRQSLEERKRQSLEERKRNT